MPTKFRYSKIFYRLGSFGFSLLWIVHNAFVPLFSKSACPATRRHRPVYDAGQPGGAFIQPPIGRAVGRIPPPSSTHAVYLFGVPLAAVALAISWGGAAGIRFVRYHVVLSMAVWRTPVVALKSDITVAVPLAGQRDHHLMGGVGSS